MPISSSTSASPSLSNTSSEPLFEFELASASNSGRNNILAAPEAMAVDPNPNLEAVIDFGIIQARPIENSVLPNIPANYYNEDSRNPFTSNHLNQIEQIDQATQTQPSLNFNAEPPIHELIHLLTSNEFPRHELTPNGNSHIVALPSLTQALIQTGLQQRNQAGFTPLWQCLVQPEVGYAAQTRASDDPFWASAPLSQPQTHGLLATLEQLCSLGADTNQPHCFAQANDHSHTVTPLFYALNNRNYDASILLLKAKALVARDGSLTSLPDNLISNICEAVIAENFKAAAAVELINLLQCQIDALNTQQDSTFATQHYLKTIERLVTLDKNNLATLLINHLPDEHLSRMLHWPDRSLLMAAIKHDNRHIAELIMQRQFNPQQYTSAYENLIFIAAQARQPQYIQVLKAHGVEPNTVNSQGIHPLHQALVNGTHATLEALLQAGAWPDYGNPQGETPLHIAVRRNDTQASGLLLKFGADSLFPNSEGLTPLQLAVTLNQANQVKFLLEQGVDPYQTNEDGRNLIDLAIHHHSRKVLSILINSNIQFRSRNDLENSHDSLVNQSLTNLYLALEQAVPQSQRLSYQQAHDRLAAIVFERQNINAIKTLANLYNANEIYFTHLHQASEKQLFSLIVAFIHADIDSTQPFALNQVNHQELLNSFIDRMADAWNAQDNEPYCQMGRANRMLDAFSGLLPGFSLLSKDTIKNEMLNKARVLRHNFVDLQSLQNQQLLADDASEQNLGVNEARQLIHLEDELREYIDTQLKKEYLDTAILAENAYTNIVSEWLDFIS